MTVSVAVAVLPVPPFVDVTLPVVLVYWPPALPVTFALNVHEPPTASVPPLRLIELEPAVAVIVPPPQLPVNPFGVLTTTPVGKVSMNATPFNGTVFALGLVIVKLSVEIPLT